MFNSREVLKYEALSYFMLLTKFTRLPTGNHMRFKDHEIILIIIIKLIIIKPITNREITYTWKRKLLKYVIRFGRDRYVDMF